MAATVLLVGSCASVPEAPRAGSPPERLDGIDATLSAIAAIAGGNVDTAAEVMVFDRTGAAREPLAGLLDLPDRVTKRLDRVCVVLWRPGVQAIWLEGRFGLLPVSLAMGLEGNQRSGDRSWHIPGGELIHESRGILRVVPSDVSAPGENLRRRGRAIFDRWNAAAGNPVLGLWTTDRGRLPADLEDAQAPFLPEELLAVAWSVSGGLELAMRTQFAAERNARVALVATRLGARRTIDRFSLQPTEMFSIDRRNRAIDIVGIVAPWESVSTVAQMIEGGRW